MEKIVIATGEIMDSGRYGSAAKPFLKWAGGKRQLLESIEKYLPRDFTDGKIKNYIEPFVGGGAVFFYLAGRYEISNAILCDINRDLVLTYLVVQQRVDGLAEELSVMEKEYESSDDEKKKEYFYDVRNKYNVLINGECSLSKIGELEVKRVAQAIFLNRTCFNGLYRLNKKGEFNVPHGRYKKPNILRYDVLCSASEALQVAEIVWGDFNIIKEKIDAPVFIYYDPPYRPLNSTSSFTSYSAGSFLDDNQIRLHKFMQEVNQPGVYQMLSNSDPKNEDQNDMFFDDLYSNFSINRVTASRMINSKGHKRGKVSELLITDYSK